MAQLVRWFWIPEWRLPAGQTSRQQLIAFPACNLVVEPAVVGLAGPTTGSSYRDLTGTGWAVGALLRPAAVPHFTGAPAVLRNRYQLLDLPVLRERVGRAMLGPDDPPTRHRQAVDAFAAWLTGTVPPPRHEALLANHMADLIDADPALRTVEDVARRLRLSARSVQRLAARFVGLPPAVMIRRRRLQDAAQRLRNDPEMTLADVAADLGYSDQAHLANEFRSVLGLTPGAYRRRVGPTVG